MGIVGNITWLIKETPRILNLKGTQELQAHTWWIPNLTNHRPNLWPGAQSSQWPLNPSNLHQCLLDNELPCWRPQLISTPRCGLDPGIHSWHAMICVRTATRLPGNTSPHLWPNLGAKLSHCPTVLPSVLTGKGAEREKIRLFTKLYDGTALMPNQVLTDHSKPDRSYWKVKLALGVTNWKTTLVLWAGKIPRSIFEAWGIEKTPDSSFLSLEGNNQNLP